MARVLIVEDDALNLKMFSLVLSKAGHAVSTADNGADGLAKLQAAADDAFDIVVTDLRMPVMDGLGLAQGAANVGLGHIPVILLTAMGDTAFHGQNFPPNVVAVLSKPISLEKLATEVTQILARGDA